MSQFVLAAVYAEFQEKVTFKGVSGRFVPGKGSIPAHLMIVGESPGENEDLRGEPFVGPAGKILSELLEEQVSLYPFTGDNFIDDLFLTNVFKYRQPKGRKPRDSEIIECRGLLRQEVTIVDPDVIVLMGRSPLNAFFPGENFHESVGTVYKVGRRAVISTHHPAAVLYDRTKMDDLRNDFGKVRDFLNGEYTGPYNSMG